MYALTHDGRGIRTYTNAMLGYAREAMSPHPCGLGSYVRFDFLIAYCFNQEQPRPDATLLDHLLRLRWVENKVFRPFHDVAFLDHPHLIRNLYRYSKPTQSHLIVLNPAPFHPIHHLSVLHYPAHTACTLQRYTASKSLSDTLDIILALYILLLSTQTKACMRSSSKPSRSTL